MVAELDKRALRLLRPDAVAAYLRAHGWEQVDTIADKSSVWVKREEGGREVADVWLPLKAELRDFTVRMAELVLAVGRVEGRSSDAILNALVGVLTDELSIRIVGPTADEGTLPLSRGAVVFPRIEELLGAAATAAIHPRRFFKRKPEKAREFLRHAQLGQTQRGSYVVTIASRLTIGESLFEDGFERKVLRTLARALAAVDGASQAHDRVAAFIASVEQGVTANLCEALHELGTSEQQEAVEFTFSWASAKPVAHERSSFRFGRDVIPAIGDAARFLAAIPPRPDFVLRGWVKSLRHEEQDFWTAPGSIVIEARVEGTIRNVSALLRPDDHLKAVEAYA